MLDAKDLAKAEKFLKGIKPMKAVFDQNYVKNLHGTNVKKGKTKLDLAEQLREDIRNFKKKNKLDRLVMVWCGSTEVFLKPEDVHKYAGVVRKSDEGEPSGDCAVHALCVRGDQRRSAVREWRAEFDGGYSGAGGIRQGEERADRRQGFQDRADSDEDGAGAGFKARMLGLNGWFSTNILGNRDGEVLDDPGSFKTKEESKLGALEYILQPELYPELYGKIHHKVRINYYPPRGDNKEGWDNIDIFGWLGYPMQIKVDFLCRDSILAAPIVLDLALFLDLAQRAGMRGIQEWLSFYFKSPMCAKELYPEHDLFIQLMKLKNTLRWMMGEDLITHLGSEYYD